MTVAGAQREQRRTLSYVPAFIDTDGKVKRLLEIGVHWLGYSYARALSEATIREDKAWSDLPGGPRLAAKRRKIASRDFFKLFAPRCLFTGDQGPGGGVITGGVEPFWDFNLRRHPYFPCVDPWWTPSEISD